MGVQPFQALHMLLHGQVRQARCGPHGSFGIWGGEVKAAVVLGWSWSVTFLGLVVVPWLRAPQ